MSQSQDTATTLDRKVSAGSRPVSRTGPSPDSRSAERTRPASAPSTQARGVVQPEEVLARLFEPELITPEQHREQMRSERTDQPEVRLMLAVIEDAVASYQRYADQPGRRNERLFEEAASWIRSTDTSWPYSFENICAALAFEPQRLREGLETWRVKNKEGGPSLYRFPFRRVNGKRHSISIRDRSANKKSA